jgi:hypothetical protein
VLAELVGKLKEKLDPKEDVDEGAKAYETRYRQQRIGRLAATAKQLGYQLAPMLLESA